MREELPGIASPASAPVGRGHGDGPEHISDRFIGRADVYAQARPGYPDELRRWIAGRIGGGSAVVDIGAGTGLFTRLLLDLGATVTALEPNGEMRAELRTRMRDDMSAGRLRVVDAAAERSGLADASVDLVAAAQAAHWFRPTEAREEFARILRPAGEVLLVWNDWREVPNAVNRDYAAVVREHLTPGNEYLDTRIPDERIPELLPSRRERRVFANPVPLTCERLRMLALSASYLPGPGEPGAGAMIDALDALFDRHERAGLVTLEYRTIAYLGR